MNRMFVFIGRFQPFHNGHLALLENAINDLGIGASADESSHDAFTILIGSSEQKDTIQNPLSSDERMNSINTAISLIRAKYDIPTNYVFVVKNNQFYLCNMLRLKIPYPELKNKIMELYTKYVPFTVLIEDKSNGSSMIQDLQC